MDGWFALTGRPALLEGLNDVCTRLDQQYHEVVENETKKREQLVADLDKLKLKVAHVERLDQENKTLREELAQLKTARLAKQVEGTKRASPLKNQPRSRESRQPLTPISANRAPSVPESIKQRHLDIETLGDADLRLEYRTLNQKYAKLREEHTHALHVNERLQKQWRENHRAYKTWEKHAADLSRQVQNRNKKIQTLKAAAAVARDGLAAGASDASDTHSTVGDATLEPARTPGQASRGLASPIKWPPGIANSQRRNSLIYRDNNFDPGEDEQAAHMFLEDVDMEDLTKEVPSVEEEPFLPPLQKTADTVVHDPVKGEPSSDAPVIVSERCVRKRRNDNGQLDETQAVRRVKTEQSSDPAVTDEQYLFAPTESDDFDNVEFRVPTPKRHHKGRGTSGAARSNVEQPDPQDTELVREGGNPPSRPSALRPLSTNSPMEKSLAQKPRPKITGSSFYGIGNQAGDADHDTTPRPSRQTKDLGRLANTGHKKGPIDLDPDNGSSETPKSPLFQFAIPEKRDLPFKNSKAIDAHRQMNGPAVNNPRPPAAAASPKKQPAVQPRRSKDLVPLRERPLSSLTRADFKPNPRYNDGLDFVHTEVIRDKDKRAQMQSRDIEPFRPHARAARESTGDLAFQSLLEAYLGEDCWKLSTMSTAEKEKMWEDAKTKELANSYSKERGWFTRMPSPPGMWNPDIPGTQEELEHRAKGLEMERQEIEERRRQALTGTARWLFRDEI